MSEVDRDIVSTIERDERWLSSQSSPVPSADGIARVKSAVRQELQRKNAPITMRRWSTWTGVLAAAAMIALAVWTGWYAMRTTSTTPFDRPLIAQTPVEPAQETQIAQASDQSSTVQTVLVSFDDRQKDLEDWSKESNWDMTGSSLSEAMNDLYGDSSSKSTERQKL